MGRLGWPPDVAMRADPQLILLAWNGYQEDREELERIIFGSQGIKLPPRRQEADDTLSFAERLLLFKREHNARWRAANAPKRRAGAKPPEPRTLKGRK
jgi:hypothetical protein